MNPDAVPNLHRVASREASLAGGRGPLALGAWLVALLSSSAPAAQAKSFIDYLEPTPITCSPLSSASWGVAGVLPRDLCNGIESAKGAGVPPDYYYWDGQIIRTKDGKYHMFMSTWAGSAGFNPGWTGSDAYHAISEQGVLGPYKRQGFVYTNNGSHKGHNVTALELPDGSYAVVVSEIVPFTIYKSNSLDGPWTSCTASIQTNGVNAGTDSHYDSNVSLTARHDGKFEIVQRHGLIAIADTLCGPYKMQKPTWAYPAANRPSIDSIYPRRTSIPDPSITNPTYTWEEDPHIWISGGVYHVLYSGSGDRIGYHLYSPDGINNWKDGGLAFNPRMAEKIFCYQDSTTCNKWYKMERPGVVLENGRVTHVTWAVADVDKDNQIPAGSNHGSKVIVVPFDGVAFDADYGVNGNAGAGGAAAMGGSTSAGGRAGGGGLPGSGGTTSAGAGSGGTTSSAGAQTGLGGAGPGGTGLGGTGLGGTGLGGTTGASGSAGLSSTGGSTDRVASGGKTNAAAGGSTGTSEANGGLTASGGSVTAGNSGNSASSVAKDSGCSCSIPSNSPSGAWGSGLLLGGLGTLLVKRRRQRR
ncbi:MAG TPA: MYXO-CTERM sorting domain-containing protein [Polyangiaceae bacterium]|nr:MYXO-CTERM sorting domain-containing protein [Polyangiaceae bacterium]